ncbi:hypothetical protein BD410DRAFT_783924 [Rickenella mellea]|uniref:RING-type domain-containing protein n=1 Tax=Rickenella mellea TaxID=50990 RepID=A0A4Y7QF93_9AGAM|nr:hypothetical protein BD410DRAFT_783924 [Rickenella mellea]
MYARSSEKLMVNYNYVETVNSNLVCCICRAPFVDPIITATCAHTFCRPCILQALDISPSCPVDRSPLCIADFRPESLLLRNMLDELIVECTHRPAGCTHSCQRQLLAAHLRDECPYAQVACAKEGCAQRVLRKDLGAHAEDCVHRITTCCACGTAVKAMDVEAHSAECIAQDTECEFCLDTVPRADLAEHNLCCPLFVVPCTHASHGCPWEGPRSVLDTSHIAQCAYEAIKGFFAIHEAQVSALQGENSSLRSRVQELDTAVQSMKRDLETAKRALGPWWRDGSSPQRSDGHSLPAITRRQSQDQIVWREVNPASNMRMYAIDGVVPRPDSDTLRPHAERDFLAQYFPPAHDGDAGYTVFGVAGAGHTNAGESSAMLSGSNVAPIDLSTTLEGALASLRSSVVTLSASLDSLGRRQDIAVTAESLRITEEVGALRGVIHGLRMQVHSIMMERNRQMTGRSGEGGQEWVPSSGPFFHGSQHSAIMPPTTSTTKL